MLYKFMHSKKYMHSFCVQVQINVQRETFDRENFRELVENTIFVKKNFAVCSVLPWQKNAISQILWRNLATKLWNSQKFSPSKIPRYMVHHSQDTMISTVDFIFLGTTCMSTSVGISLYMFIYCTLSADQVIMLTLIQINSIVWWYPKINSAIDSCNFVHTFICNLLWCWARSTSGELNGSFLC